MVLAKLAPETRNLIDGRLAESSSGARFENRSPATEEVLGTCADGTKDDMEAALTAARRAFDESDWANDPALRARCLDELRDGLEAEKDQSTAAYAEAIGGQPLLGGSPS